MEAPSDVISPPALVLALDVALDVEILGATPGVAQDCRYVENNQAMQMKRFRVPKVR